LKPPLTKWGDDMASGRIIRHSLGDSEKIAALTDDTARFAYTLLVAYSDAEGRFIADPITLRGKLYTRLPWTPDTVERCLQELHKTHLIVLYQHENKRYGVIVDFHKHNNIRMDADGYPRDEAKSYLPDPPSPDPAGDPLLPNKDVRSTLAAHAYRVRAGHGVSGSTAWPLPSNPGVPLGNPGTTLAEVEVEVEQEAEQEQDLQPSSAKPTRAANYTAFLEAWNYHRGALPAARSLDAKRKRGIDALRKEHGDSALALFEAAVQCVATDDYWVQQGYGLDNLLRAGRVLEKAEKFVANQGMSAGDRKLATTASVIARAIGGLDA
jgi:hypothetical protein